MNSDNPGATARIAGIPLHSRLASFPIVCFTGTLLTDIAYASTANMLWADFSAWLLAAGMATGVLTGLVGLFDFVRNPRVRALRPAWPHVIGNVLVLVLALFDNFVHSRDAWNSVVPSGIILSAAIVVVMLVTTWLGSAMAYRQGAGVQYPGAGQ